ncbi:endonuclease [Demetria terragena]|uniref:endonuclease n=1 Tax=Demetria terragena TaxID=63959 RepID=UPI00038290E7|nr:endonuclease [Demetria terragena]
MLITVRRSVAALGVAALAVTPTLASPLTAMAAPWPSSMSAAYAASLSVTDALARQDGSSQTVRGYVVGQPTGTNSVVTSKYPNDYAIALADRAGETDPSKMLFIQLSSGLRSTWGLASNPNLRGTQVDATGSLSAYFSHPGLKSASSIATAGDPTDPPTDPTDPPTDPTDPPSDPGDYYAGTEGLTGPALKTKLNTIISKQTVLSYGDVWDALGKTDQDPNNSNNVIQLYTGKSTPKSNNGGGADNWNREHVWAKSHGDFGTSNGPGTDVHHLRPTDVTVNSDRGNLDFDEGGTENDEAPGNFSDSDSWEPRDAVKGDVARMIFYMAVRYEGSGGAPDLEVNDKVNNGSAPYMGRLSVLKAWSQQDPPDAFEKNRNEVIFTSIQKNRNPFIDHPEWVAAIF